MLDGTSVNQAHSITKGTLWIWDINQVHLVNIGKSLWFSIYRERSTNEGFSCFSKLSSIELFAGSRWLRRWILIILSCIQVDLIMCKIYIRSSWWFNVWNIIEDLMMLRGIELEG